MKKHLLFLSLVMLVFPVVCYAEGSTEAGKAKATLTVWDFKYGEEFMGVAMREIDKLYTVKNPAVVVEHLAQPLDQYYDVLRAGIASGAGPDVAMGAVDDRMWAFASKLVSLDERIAPWRKEIPEDIWLSCTPGNNFANGIKLSPLTIQGVGWYYNKLLFKKAGLDPKTPPAKWTDFLAASETLKKAGIVPIVWGNTPAYYTDWMRRSLVANFYGPAGVEGFANGKSNFTDPEYVTIIEMIKELRDKDYLDPQGASKPTFMDSVDQFKTGKGAMYMGLISDVAHWKDFSDALGADNVGYFPNINHPKAKFQDRQMNQLAGIGYGILTSSKNQDLAATYIRGYSSGEGPGILVKHTGAMVPNTAIDLSGLGYPALTDILKYLKNNSAPDLKRYISATARQKSMDYDTLIFNAKEITVDEYIKRTQSVLNASR